MRPSAWPSVRAAAIQQAALKTSSPAISAVFRPRRVSLRFLSRANRLGIILSSVANYTFLTPHCEIFLSSEGGVESKCQETETMSGPIKSG
jgi:hypothetical protein